MSPLYATISWAYSVFFILPWNLHSKQIETLELAPKFVEQLFVNNNKTYDDTIAQLTCDRMLALPVVVSINSSLKIDWNGRVKTKTKS